MGILNSMFRNEAKNTHNNINWIPLTSIDQLKKIREQSKLETVFLFKHSTRCGISSIVLKRFEKLFDEDIINVKVYYLDLLNYRNVSNEVANIFQVIHQSPQLLIVRNQSVVLNVSHYDITTVNIKKYL
tara:strand:- start:81656 stop:82042 length:387 start_codon:yes stop_codon:yes gene_type:complete